MNIAMEKAALIYHNRLRQEALAGLPAPERIAAEMLPQPPEAPVRVLLRLEGAAVFAAGGAAFFLLGAPWWLFLALFFLPDLGLAGYLRDRRTGAATYNAAHSYVGPLALAGLGLATPALLPVAAVWIAHIGFDRALGYGLKYRAGFGFTHLGKIGH